MHPCSQPRYGLTLVSNPTSGLSFRAMIVFVRSRKNWVSRRGFASSSLVGSIWTTSSSPRSTWSFSNRFAGFHEALRPWMAGEGGGVSSTIGTNFFFFFRGAGTAQVHMNISGCRTQLEHRHLACVANGHLARCLQATEQARRLLAAQARCLCSVKRLVEQSSDGTIPAKANRNL